MALQEVEEIGYAATVVAAAINTARRIALFIFFYSFFFYIPSRAAQRESFYNLSGGGKLYQEKAHEPHFNKHSAKYYPVENIPYYEIIVSKISQGVANIIVAPRYYGFAE